MSDEDTNFYDETPSGPPFDRFKGATETATHYCCGMYLHEDDADDVVADVERRLARQARTIRRLRVLADGYRAKYKAEYEHHEVTLQEHGLDLRDARRRERTHIVAYLRREAANPGLYHDEEAYMRAATAIERGEL